MRDHAQSTRGKAAQAAGPAPVRALERTPALRYLPHVMLATALVGVCPIAVVWWLRDSGIVSSYVPGVLVGMVLAMGGAHLGRAFWQKRPGSQDVLFSELMVWGYARRLLSQARLESARRTLGTMSEAQRGVAGGLSAEHQASTLERLAKLLDARDPGTHGHSRRVARYAWMIATRMGLPAEQVARIRTAAAVHDLGKIQTPNSILRKAGPLTDEEYEAMKRHAGDGARMAEALNDTELTAMVEHHHERLDGTGYPDGLAGDQIPLGARIISVADTFDSITAHRAYRAAKPHKVALDILRNEAGRQLDPDAVRAFCGYYSGRRPLAFWSAFTALPERVLGELGNGLAGAASAAKVVAVAAILGNVAAGTASLAGPSKGRTSPTASAAPTSASSRAVSSASAPGSTSADALSGTARGRSGRGSTLPQIAHSPSTGSSAVSRGPVAAQESTGAPSQPPAVGPAEPSDPSQGASESHPARHTESARTSEGGKTPSEAPASGPEVGTHRAEPGQGALEGTKKTVEGTVEAVKGTVEATSGKVEEVKGAVEGTVEGVKGKVEEAKGRVEETKGKVEREVGKVLPKL